MGLSASMACGELCRSAEDENTCLVLSTEAPERNHKHSLYITDRVDSKELPTLLHPARSQVQEQQDVTSYFKTADVPEEPSVANHGHHQLDVQVLSHLDVDGTRLVTKDELLELAKQISNAESHNDTKVKLQPSNDVLDLSHDGRVKARKGTGYGTKEDLTRVTDSEHENGKLKVRFQKTAQWDVPHDGRVKVRKGTGYVKKGDLPAALALVTCSDQEEVTRSDQRVHFREPSQVFDLPHDGRVRARKGTGYVKKEDVQDLIETKDENHRVRFRALQDVFDLPHDGRVQERKSTGFVTKQDLAMLLGAVGSAETVGEDDAAGGESCGGQSFEYGRMRTSMLGRSELVQAFRDACVEGEQMQGSDNDQARQSSRHAHNMRTAMLVSKSALINAVLARVKTSE